MPRSVTAVLSLLTLCFASAFGQAPAHSPAPAKVIVVHAAHMLDGNSSTLSGPVTVTITNGRISSVAPGTTGSPDAEVIELGDQTLMPGLIDAHKHMGGPPSLGMNPFQSRLTISDFEVAIGASAMARKLLLEGFTTVRNVGSSGGVDLALKRDIDRGWVPGPRIIVSLEPISVSGGHSDPRNGIDPEWTNRNWGGSIADGPEEFAKQVREHRRRGAEVIKIMPSGGVLSIGDDPKVQTMTDAEIKSAIDTAHNLGLKVAAHAHGKAAIDSAVRNGVDSIEHGTYADAESFRLMKEHGTYLVPTLLVADQVHEMALHHPEQLNPSAAQKALEVTPLMKGMLGAAYKAGVKIAFGTDTSRGNNAHEFALMVDAGLTPADALFAATRNAADLVGVTGSAGCIRVGCFADMIAVNGDPLHDITTMEHVQWVMKGGIVYKRDGQPVAQPVPAGAYIESADMDDE
ncbi:MAG TPA: amidohydrolase family protein [Acidobacteriaceae bacterium]|nr:amidohydrolase family protein [Acidobacteriaceae bacterium]